ncbi:hypothetical protein ACEZDB_10250 [Streptacidiphilus sp. N1-3]|uniref:Uncharacterized protein n=1 Tax=Streptacidiphilus alkalitolerans TaxID=3342712 RepID=A0ABV6WZA0_9ACTN
MTTPQQSSPLGGRPVRLSVDTGGTLAIGDLAETWALSAPLLLPGGLLVVDPFAPGEPPVARVDDLAAAADWLAAVYGAAAAETAEEVVEQARRASVPRNAPLEYELASAARPWLPGSHHRPMARLASAVWLERWSPRPLDQGLLDLEIGTLLWEVADLVPDAGVSGRERLEGVAGRLDALLDVVDDFQAAPLNALDSIIVERLTGAAQAADEFLAGHPLHPGFAARARLAARRSAEGAQLAEQLRAGRIPSYEALGRTGQATSVDWVQVPPGVLAPEDNTVEWSWTGTPEAATLTVRVPTLRGAEPGDGFAFRVYRPGEPLPVAVAELHYGENRLVGTARLPESAAGDPAALTVDVFHTRLVGPPRTGRAAEYAAAERQAVRNLGRLRLLWGGRLPCQAMELAAWADFSREVAAELRRWSEHTGDDPLARRVSALADTAGHAADRLRAGALGSWPLADPVWLPTVAEWSAFDPDLLFGELRS